MKWTKGRLSFIEVMIYLRKFQLDKTRGGNCVSFFVLEFGVELKGITHELPFQLPVRLHLYVGIACGAPGCKTRGPSHVGIKLWCRCMFRGSERAGIGHLEPGSSGVNVQPQNPSWLSGRSLGRKWGDQSLETWRTQAQETWTKVCLQLHTFSFSSTTVFSALGLI